MIITAYIKAHLRFLEHIFLSRVTKFDGRTFAYLMNIYCWAKFTGISFSYDKSDAFYSYRDKEIEPEIFFKSKFRAQKYYKGIRYRSDILGADYLLKHINFNTNDIVIDCGANIGELYYWFYLRDLKVRYIAFEPSPTEFLALKRNVTDGEIYNLGLWDKNDIINFYISSDHADSSLIQPKSYDHILPIQTITLDGFINKKIKLLKLEAEGAEPEILRGIGDKISNIEYISADLGFERGQSCDSTFVPVTNFLLSKNFELIDIAYPRITAIYKNKSYQ